MASNSSISAASYVFSSESMGGLWNTGSNPACGAPPTRWVGELGEARSGCSRSSRWSSFISWSYS